MRAAVMHGCGHRDSRRPTIEDNSSRRILEFIYETVHDCTVARVVFARVNRRGEAAGSLLREQLLQRQLVRGFRQRQ